MPPRPATPGFEITHFENVYGNLFRRGAGWTIVWTRLNILVAIAQFVMLIIALVQIQNSLNSLAEATQRRVA